MTPSDDPWYRDLSALPRRPWEFFPSRTCAPAECLNAMVRFTAYASIAIALVRQDWSVLGVGALVALVLSVVYYAPTRRGSVMRRAEGEAAAGNCGLPTPDNPFTNVLTNEYMLDKQRACGGPASAALTARYFDAGLPREIADVYHNRASDRQFVTMPVSGHHGIPDTRAFRNFLFAHPGSAAAV